MMLKKSLENLLEKEGFCTEEKNCYRYISATSKNNFLEFCAKWAKENDVRLFRLKEDTGIGQIMFVEIGFYEPEIDARISFICKVLAWEGEEKTYTIDFEFDIQLMDNHFSVCNLTEEELEFYKDEEEIIERIKEYFRDSAMEIIEDMKVKIIKKKITED